MLGIFNGMIRTFFWILLVVNILFFVAMYWMLPLIERNQQEEPAPRDLHAAKIMIVPTEPKAGVVLEPKTVATPTSSALQSNPVVADPVVPVDGQPAAVVPENTVETPLQAEAETVVAAAQADTEAVDTESTATTAETTATEEAADSEALAASDAQQDKLASPLCMEWGSFAGDDLARGRALLDSLSLEKSVVSKHIPPELGYWVYIPPVIDQAQREAKIAHLVAQGVTDYFVVKEQTEWQHAISLGVFKTKDGLSSCYSFYNKNKLPMPRSGSARPRPR